MCAQHRPSDTPASKCLSQFKVIFLFQFILALYLVFQDYLLHLILLQRGKIKIEKNPNSAPKTKAFADNTDGQALTIFFLIKKVNSLSSEA